MIALASEPVPYRVAYSERVRQRLLALADIAREHLARVGYDPAYGARPLKRTIHKEVETVLGRMLLQGKIRDGQKVLVDYQEDKGLMFLPQTAHETVAV